MINIQIAYAKNADISQQAVLELTTNSGINIQQAIHSSGIIGLLPEINLEQQAVGIFGQLQSLSTIVQDKDRIEIYTPLPFDPNTARKLKRSQE